MDPMTVLAFGQFVLAAVKEGTPVVEKVIELLRSRNDPQARDLLAELESEYAASRTRAQAAFDKLEGT